MYDSEGSIEEDVYGGINGQTLNALEEEEEEYEDDWKLCVDENAAIKTKRNMKNSNYATL